MQANVETEVISGKVIWAGRITSALPVLLILLGATMKLMMLPQVLEGFARSGYSEHLVFPIGLIELICAIVYLIPRTSVLGAILLTALLGGATATNVRVSDPTWVVTVI